MAARAWPWLAAGALLAPAAAGAVLAALGLAPAWVALTRSALLLALAAALASGGPATARPRWRGAPQGVWATAALAGVGLALWQAATGPLFLPAHLPAATWAHPEVWGHLLAAAAVAPVAEELYFRGVLLPRLVAALGPGRGILAGAALFALAHLETAPLRLAELAAAGTLYGLLWHRCGCLLPPTLAHAANNLAAVLWGH